MRTISQFWVSAGRSGDNFSDPVPDGHAWLVYAFQAHPSSGSGGAGAELRLSSVTVGGLELDTNQTMGPDDVVRVRQPIVLVAGDSLECNCSSGSVDILASGMDYSPV